MTQVAAKLPAIDASDEDLSSVSRQTSIYVYEAPVRIWHWVNALAIVVLCITGYFIGSPPPSMQIGEAFEQFVFGYIRFAHFAAGLVLTVGFLGRIYWAFFGNHHARQLFYVPFWKGTFWKEVWMEIKWYLFSRRSRRNTWATIRWRSSPCSSSSRWG